MNEIKTWAPISGIKNIPDSSEVYMWESLAHIPLSNIPSQIELLICFSSGITTLTRNSFLGSPEISEILPMCNPEILLKLDCLLTNVLFLSNSSFNPNPISVKKTPSSSSWITSVT